MDIKLFLTQQFLKDLNLPTDSISVKKYLHAWWINSRLNGNRSLSLTTEGYETLSEKIGLKFYRIDILDGIYITNKLLIWLDRFVDCPYYLSNGSIFVSKEKVAVQLILFDGDLYKFGKTKELVQKVN